MQLSQAYQLLQTGQLEQARELCETLIRQGQPNARVLVLMSAIQQRLGDRQAATQYLLQAAGLQTHDVPGLLGTIKALRTIGALDEASQLLDRLDPGHAEVAISRAQTQWQNGQYTQALAGFEAAAERWPQNPEATSALARALLRLARHEQAERVLQDALERWPGSDELSRLYAVLELDRGNLDTALSRLQGRIPEGPNPGLPQKMLAALQQVAGQSTSSPLAGDDVVNRGFSWVREHAPGIRWFGTNSGLLNWTLGEIPDGLPANSPVVECGVYHGFSLRLISDRTERPIHGFDSFQGLPESWKPGEPAGSYSTAGRLPDTAANVQLHSGWFEDTLPGFAAGLEAPIALLHVDCDLYSSTKTVLEYLGPRLAQGSLLVFDDLLSYEGYEQHEFRAAQEYFATTHQSFELVGAVLLGRAVAYRMS